MNLRSAGVQASLIMYFKHSGFGFFNMLQNESCSSWISEITFYNNHDASSSYHNTLFVYSVKISKTLITIIALSIIINLYTHKVWGGENKKLAGEGPPKSRKH